MKAMILAAGRGERMKPLTDNCPKPLLKVAGISLIEHHLNNLKAAAITDIVINVSWLGEQIKTYFKDGRNFGVNIRYSDEKNSALETAGGIVKALPLLGSKPFLLVNGDIFCDYDLSHLTKHEAVLKTGQLAHLIMVNNPEHNPNGDFCLSESLLKVEQGNMDKYTYSGMGLYHPKLFKGMSIEKAPLAPILIAAIQKNQISASLHQGIWSDVGTPERLQQINLLAMQ